MAATLSSKFALGEVSAQVRQEIENMIATKLEQANNQKLADTMRVSLRGAKKRDQEVRGALTGEISDLPNPLADRRLN
jgi:hypothetical protein